MILGALSFTVGAVRLLLAARRKREKEKHEGVGQSA